MTRPPATDPQAPTQAGDRYAAVIFDFGGVLTKPMDDTARCFAREVGLPDDAYRQAVAVHPTGRQLYAQLERGQISQEEWNTGIAALLGIDGTNLMGRALATLRPEESVVAAAAAIRATGLRTAILSNSMGLAPHNPYTPWALETCHDVVVLSEQHRLRKPEREIYELTLDLLGLPGSACIFVDDNSVNLVPARELGMTTIHAIDPASTVSQLRELIPCQRVSGP
ncbi:HAD family phosphatase [Streptomyces sp. H10-C2]|uniref:HAD family hydrolase n=1 Tax=unclassified Streptomyces TaxID=2593676 RepID=UPI0024BA541F|nr:MULTISPECIES: HAD family phosphatase [unclassified Streptomyces]MDJ0342792.1 HAD family phosphatase [Streptomyces sp. PH10-H1]MDJ0372470.1 HAD family phosphatase [Streptomyces sp. H10-C2]